MIFYDMNEISKNLGVDNKYMITLAVAQRARQLSERRVRPLLGEEVPDEKFISEALEDLEEARINVEFGPTAKVQAEPAADDDQQA